MVFDASSSLFWLLIPFTDTTVTVAGLPTLN